MNEQELNDLLMKGLKASEAARQRGEVQLAVAILQLTSVVALKFLPKSHKVICSYCKKQIRKGMEVEFWKATGTCYSCDKGYIETLEAQL